MDVDSLPLPPLDDSELDDANGNTDSAAQLSMEKPRSSMLSVKLSC